MLEALTNKPQKKNQKLNLLHFFQSLKCDKKYNPFYATNFPCLFTFVNKTIS